MARGRDRRVRARPAHAGIRIAERAVLPFVILSQTVPLIALAPLIRNWGSRLEFGAFVGELDVRRDHRELPRVLPGRRGRPAGPSEPGCRAPRPHAQLRGRVVDHAVPPEVARERAVPHPGALAPRGRERGRSSGRSSRRSRSGSRAASAGSSSRDRRRRVERSGQALGADPRGRAAGLVAAGFVALLAAFLSPFRRQETVA